MHTNHAIYNCHGLHLVDHAYSDWTLSWMKNGWWWMNIIDGGWPKKKINFIWIGLQSG